MRNFLLFIRRFFNLILFLGLEVVCAVLIARTNTMQGNEILNSSNTVTGFIYQRQSAMVYYFGLGRMNDSLLQENARLRKELAEARYSTDTLKDSVMTRKVETGDTLHPVRYANYIYRTARVNNNSVAEKNNYVTLNRGSADGIAPGMAVISGTGIVGKVMHVSRHFATVLSVLSDIQPVSSRLKDGTTGLARWDFEKRNRNPDIVYMADIPAEIPMHVGDSAFTTSYSFFPPDILVGIIYHVDLIKKNNKRLLYMHPATNFRNIQYVYVVENTMRDEQTELEQLNKKEGKKK